MNALKMDPSNRVVIRQLGLTFLQLGKSPQAALLLRKAADLDPERSGNPCQAERSLLGERSSQTGA